MVEGADAEFATLTEGEYTEMPFWVAWLHNKEYAEMCVDLMYESLVYFHGRCCAESNPKGGLVLSDFWC